MQRVSSKTIKKAGMAPAYRESPRAGEKEGGPKNPKIPGKLEGPKKKGKEKKEKEETSKPKPLAVIDETVNVPLFVEPIRSIHPQVRDPLVSFRKNSRLAKPPL